MYTNANFMQKLKTTYILNANLAAPHLLQTQGTKWVAVVLVALKCDIGRRYI